MNQPPPPHRRRESQRAPGPESTVPGYLPYDGGIDFARPVPDNGYLWWYVDAISDDGNQAMTLIVFVGSVFSPYYASARQKERTAAEHHCAFNTILYGPGGRKRWSMTERSSRHLNRNREQFSLGPSSLHWNGESLEALIDERCVPTPRSMRGRIRITPGPITSHSLMLDRNGHHRWYPLSPVARVEVDFPSLGSRWSGSGYLDSNTGSEPLSDGFTGWDWLRMHTHDGRCRVRYEAREADQQPHRLALCFDADGSLTSETPTPGRKLPMTPVWRIERKLPDSSPVSLNRTLEDTPFYARSLIRSDAPVLGGVGFHESLSMERFVRPWVQRLLPFRMPRVR